MHPSEGNGTSRSPAWPIGQGTNGIEGDSRLDVVLVRRWCPSCVQLDSRQPSFTEVLNAVAQRARTMASEENATVSDNGLRVLRHRHVQRGQDELGPEMGLHRPADDAPTPRIEHDGEKEEAGPGRNVRDVRHPEPVGARGRELPLDEIRVPAAPPRRAPS